MELSHKNALVCGGSKGIGKAVAHALAAMGAHVTIVARSADLMPDIIGTLPRVQAGQDHDFLVADFNDPEHLRLKVMALVSERH